MRPEISNNYDEYAKVSNGKSGQHEKTDESYKQRDGNFGQESKRNTGNKKNIVTEMKKSL